MHRLKFIIVVIIFFVLTGCAVPESNMNNNPISELEKYRQIWQSQKISNYEYTYNKMCFCPPPANVPARVLIIDNVVNQVSNLETDQAIDNPDLNFYQTIDKLFEVIEEAIQKGADKIEVAYDQNLGYPTSISIDYIKMAADDEIAFSATDLVPITD